MNFEDWWNETTEEEQFGEQEQTQLLKDYCYSLIDNTQWSKFATITTLKLYNRIDEAKLSELLKIKQELLDAQIDPIHERGAFSNKEYNKRYGRS